MHILWYYRPHGTLIVLHIFQMATFMFPWDGECRYSVADVNEGTLFRMVDRNLVREFTPLVDGGLSVYLSACLSCPGGRSGVIMVLWLYDRIQLIWFATAPGEISVNKMYRFTTPTNYRSNIWPYCRQGRGDVRRLGSNYFSSKLGSKLGCHSWVNNVQHSSHDHIGRRWTVRCGWELQCQTKSIVCCRLFIGAVAGHRIS